jgi:hypothetical protein
MALVTLQHAIGFSGAESARSRILAALRADCQQGSPLAESCACNHRIPELRLFVQRCVEKDIRQTVRRIKFHFWINLDLKVALLSEEVD